MSATVPDEPIIEIPIRISFSHRWQAISNDYYVYLGVSNYDISQIIDPVNLKKNHFLLIIR